MVKMDVRLMNGRRRELLPGHTVLAGAPLQLEVDEEFFDRPPSFAAQGQFEVPDEFTARCDQAHDSSPPGGTERAPSG